MAVIYVRADSRVRIIPLVHAAVVHTIQTFDLSFGKPDVAQIFNLEGLLEDKLIDFRTFYWLCNSSV
jgi:hypothetical protein